MNYYEMTLDVVVILGLGAFLWSIAHSFRLIAEAKIRAMSLPK